MDHSTDLVEKINMLSENHQKIALKLLGYISVQQYSKTQMQNLIREDIRELVVLEENNNAFK